MIQPRPGILLGTQKDVQLADHLLDLHIRILVDQAAAILVRLLIECFHLFRQRAVQQAFEKALVAHTRHGVGADGLKVAADQLDAKLVQGADIGCAQAVPLRLEGLVAPGLLRQHPLQALAHLAGGGAGEGDDQHVLDADPFAQQGHDALDQHRRLAGACCRAD